jgi:hypothetical protein
MSYRSRFGPYDKRVCRNPYSALPAAARILPSYVNGAAANPLCARQTAVPQLSAGYRLENLSLFPYSLLFLFKFWVEGEMDQRLVLGKQQKIKNLQWKFFAVYSSNWQISIEFIFKNFLPIT